MNKWVQDHTDITNHNQLHNRWQSIQELKDGPFGHHKSAVNICLKNKDGLALKTAKEAFANHFDKNLFSQHSPYNHKSVNNLDQEQTDHDPG
jgi:hypothetical protein